MRTAGPNPPPTKVTIPVWRIGLCTAIACCTAGCAVSHAPIIERYKAAACIPFSPRPSVTPHTREWDTTLTLTDGSTVVVSGADMVGGRIDVSYPGGRALVVANAGDYVYPCDVRMNAQNDRLYVKASGLAGGIWQQTWLFEYDLRGQRLLARQKVIDDALPAECPEPSSGR